MSTTRVVWILSHSDRDENEAAAKCIETIQAIGFDRENIVLNSRSEEEKDPDTVMQGAKNVSSHFQSVIKALGEQRDAYDVFILTTPLVFILPHARATIDALIEEAKEKKRITLSDKSKHIYSVLDIVSKEGIDDFCTLMREAEELFSSSVSFPRLEELFEKSFKGTIPASNTIWDSDVPDDVQPCAFHIPLSSMVSDRVTTVTAIAEEVTKKLAAVSE